MTTLFMSIDATELERIAALAYIGLNEQATEELIPAIETIIQLTDTLKTVDTAHVSPMYHPMDTIQPLREDIIAHNNHQTQFSKLAPDFEDGLFIVPQVITSGD